MLYRLKTWLCFASILVVLVFQFSYQVFAATNVIKVKAKTPGGSSQEIDLYSGYHALVIGCGNYQQDWPTLPNATKDAQVVGKMLKDMGWDVNLVLDPDTKMVEDSFAKLITGAGREPDRGILIWYSGHGYTLNEADGSKLGYIVPTNAPNPVKDEFGFMRTAISMRDIETLVKRIFSKHVLVIFDSCFSGAIFRMVRAAPSQYINEKVAAPVRQFITAGNEDEQVPDKSVFKDVLLKGIRDGYGDINEDGYITGEELGAYLSEEVVNYSRGAQHPQFGKINNPALDRGDFVFVKLEVSELDKLTQEIGRLRKELAGQKKLKDENVRLQSELAGYKKKEDESARLQSELAGHKKLKDENVRLQSELAGQKKLKAENVRLQKELAENKKLVAALRSEKNTTKQVIVEQPKPVIKKEPKPVHTKPQPGAKLSVAILPWKMLGDANPMRTKVKDSLKKCVALSTTLLPKYSYYIKKDARLLNEINSGSLFNGKEPNIARVAEIAAKLDVDLAIIGLVKSELATWQNENWLKYQKMFIVDRNRQQVFATKDSTRAYAFDAIPSFICKTIYQFEEGELQPLGY